MATFLFDSAVFGPVFSRRLGRSLGINLLANDRKICNFNCVYCECGLTQASQQVTSLKYQERRHVRAHLEQKLKEMIVSGNEFDTITFAGNGEPTMHPDFPLIVDDVIALRDEICPQVKVAVLSNATMIPDEKVVLSLKRVDHNILKLDSAIPSTVVRINRPLMKFSIDEIIRNMKRFNTSLIVQTLFLKAEMPGIKIDNTTEEEVTAWLDAIKMISPSGVMIYTFSRSTPVAGLERISPEQLDAIAAKVKDLGIETQVSY